MGTSHGPTVCNGEGAHKNTSDIRWENPNHVEGKIPDTGPAASFDLTVISILRPHASVTPPNVFFSSSVLGLHHHQEDTTGDHSTDISVCLSHTLPWGTNYVMYGLFHRVCTLSYLFGVIIDSCSPFVTAFFTNITGRALFVGHKYFFKIYAPRTHLCC